MATLKHLGSKNADYGAAEAYLTFEHDEFTMKPTLDEQGRLIPRKDYRVSTLNCGDEDFAVAYMRSNLRYRKNQRREDVKSHHYIISFDPRDEAHNGLTADRAQALGEKFCAEHFPGHQALICTTWTDITTAATFMCISSSTAFGLRKSRSYPTWTGQPTRKPGASTAVPTRPCATSSPKSWRCATGRGFTKSTS